MTAMLNVKDLRAYYGQVQALHGLSFALNEGSLTTLLGANGAGKTTTLRAICNMVRSTGAIEFDGAPLTGRSTENIVRLGIAHVPQGRGTFTTMTVEENLQLGAITRNDKAGVISDIERMYDHFPVLKERHTQQAGTLSGGEQQMLAVARALMLRPRLMLLDEPSFGLAPLIVRDLFKILGKINREDKVTILVVEQNAQLALELADKAYVIETGRIVMSGSAAEIANNAMKPATLVRIGALASGLNSKRSMTIPPAKENASVSTNAPQYGTPHCISCQETKVENIAISPWAKLRWSIA